MNPIIKERSERIDELDELLKKQENFLNEKKEPLVEVEKKENNITIPPIEKEVIKPIQIRKDHVYRLENVKFTKDNDKVNISKKQKKPSLFAMRRKMEKETINCDKDTYSQEDKLNLENKSKEVLNDILEKDIGFDTTHLPLKIDIPQSSGFPTIPIHENFALSQSSSEQSHLNLNEVTQNLDEKEMSDISLKNQQIIDRMSIEEIKQAKRELLASLDPEFINKLTNGKYVSSKNDLSLNPLYSSNKTDNNINNYNEKQIDNKLEVKKKVVSFAPNVEFVECNSSNSFFDNDTVDVIDLDNNEDLSASEDKNKDISDSEDDQNPFRFDFKGYLLDDKIIVPESKGLHHHGKARKSAGYSIEELLIYASSLNPSQKTIAINIISKILLNLRQGDIFKESEQKEIIKQFREFGLAPRLFFALKDKNFTVQCCAIDLLASWIVDYDFYGSIDNIQDLSNDININFRSFPYFYKGNEIYSTASFNCSDPNSIPREEDGVAIPYATYLNNLAKYDTVYGLLKMEILNCLSKIMKTGSILPLKTLYSILNILICLGRYSSEISSMIYREKDLLYRLKQQANRLDPLYTLLYTRLIKTLMQSHQLLAKKLDDENFIDHEYFHEFIKLDSDKPYIVNNKAEAYSISAFHLQCEILEIYRLFSLYNLPIKNKDTLFDILTVYHIYELKEYFLNKETSEKLSVERCLVLTMLYRFLSSLSNSMIQSSNEIRLTIWIRFKVLFKYTLSFIKYLEDIEIVNQPSYLLLISSVNDYIISNSTLLFSGLIEDSLSLRLMEEKIALLNFNEICVKMVNLGLASVNTSAQLKNISNKPNYFKRFLPSIENSSIMQRLHFINNSVSLYLDSLRSFIELSKFHHSQHLTTLSLTTVCKFILNVIDSVSSLPKHIVFLIKPLFDLIFTVLQSPNLTQVKGIYSISLFLFNNCNIGDTYYNLALESMFNLFKKDNDLYKEETYVKVLSLFLKRDESYEDIPGFIFEYKNSLRDVHLLWILSPLKALWPIKIDQTKKTEVEVTLNYLDIILLILDYAYSIYIYELETECKSKLVAPIDRFYLIHLLFLENFYMLNPSLTSKLYELLTVISNYEISHNKKLVDVDFSSKSLDQDLSDRFQLFKDSIEVYLDTCFNHPVYIPILLTPLRIDINLFTFDFRRVIWQRLIPKLPPQCFENINLLLPNQVKLDNQCLDPYKEQESSVLKGLVKAMFLKPLIPEVHQSLFYTVAYSLREHLDKEHDSISELILSEMKNMDPKIKEQFFLRKKD